MPKNNLLIVPLLATILLTSAFFASAAAQDLTDGSSQPSSDPSSLPEPTAKSDEPQNGTQTDDTPIEPDSLVSGNPDETLYTIQDNSTDTEGAEDANLIATQTGPNNTWAITIIAILLAIIAGGVIGVFYYRKRA